MASTLIALKEKNTFGLSETEKRVIEADINAGKPIMATPEYLKFLKAIMPDGLRIEDDMGAIQFSPQIHEYEIYKGSVRTDYLTARYILWWLTELFDQWVRFPVVLEAQDRIANHQHFAGVRYYNNGNAKGFGTVGFAWIAGNCIKYWAPCVYRSPNSVRGDKGVSHYLDGLSIFPVFE
jgi:hypothetical protein